MNGINQKNYDNSSGKEVYQIKIGEKLFQYEDKNLKTMHGNDECKIHLLTKDRFEKIEN